MESPSLLAPRRQPNRKSRSDQSLEVPSADGTAETDPSGMWAHWTQPAKLMLSVGPGAGELEFE